MKLLLSLLTALTLSAQSIVCVNESASQALQLIVEDGKGTLLLRDTTYDLTYVDTIQTTNNSGTVARYESRAFVLGIYNKPRLGVIVIVNGERFEYPDCANIQL